MHLFFGMLFRKNFANLLFIFLTLVTSLAVLAWHPDVYLIHFLCTILHNFIHLLDGLLNAVSGNKPPPIYLCDPEITAEITVRGH